MLVRVAMLVLTTGAAAGGLWLSRWLGPAQLWLFGAGLIGLVGIGTETFLRESPTPEPGSHYQLFALWIAPGLLIAAGLWLGQAMPADSLPAIVVAMAVLMAVLLLALLASFDPNHRFHRLGRFVGNLILYMVVFVLFALVYHTKERSLFTATATGLVALLATLEVLRFAQARLAAAWRLAGIAALVMAETTWALNYWPIGGLVGGAFLLLAFYVVTGLLVAVYEGGLDRRVVAEYGTVCIAGLLAISWAMA